MKSLPPHLLRELRRNHDCSSPASPEELKSAKRRGFPADLLEFYAHTDGAYLHATGVNEGDFVHDGREWNWRIPPIQDLRTVYELGFVDPAGPLAEQTKKWLALVDVGDGDWLGLNLDAEARGEVIDCFHETVGQPGYNAVIAESFSELLGKLLETPRAFWLEEGEKGFRAYRVVY